MLRVNAKVISLKFMNLQREKKVSTERNLDECQENNLAELRSNHQIACNSIYHARLMKITKFPVLLSLPVNFLD